PSAPGTPRAPVSAPLASRPHVAHRCALRRAEKGLREAHGRGAVRRFAVPWHGPEGLSLRGASVRGATLRVLERVAEALPPVDRERVRAKIAAEVARLDEAFALPGGVLSVGEQREQSRGVLRAPAHVARRPTARRPEART